MNAIIADTLIGGTKDSEKKGRDPIAEKKRRKKSMNSRSLKQHLKCLIPEYKLALIKEPSKAPTAITCATDVDLF
ncbi:hypothetical protein ABTP07_19720, partial [Acinetobacter baumannii]